MSITYCCCVILSCLAVFFKATNSVQEVCYSKESKCLMEKGNNTCFANQRKTRNGRDCVAWSNYETHKYLPNGHVDLNGLALVENRCARPDGERPWCFIDNEGHYGSCFNYNCIDTYENYPRFETIDGHHCDEWKIHGEINIEYNYCHNLDDHVDGPWCYRRSDGTRNHCYPPCGEIEETLIESCLQKIDFDQENICYSKPHSCTMNRDGAGGCIDPKTQTKYGEICTDWSEYLAGASDTENWRYKEMIPYQSVPFKTNECSLHDGSTVPWCYTSKRARYCFVDCTDCRQGYHPKTTTVQGVTCDPWSGKLDDARVAAHVPLPLRTNDNECQNPNDDTQGPWCFTSTKPRGWDYCYRICPVFCNVPALTSAMTMYQLTADFENPDYKMSGYKISPGDYMIGYKCSNYGTFDIKTVPVTCQIDGQLSPYSDISTVCGETIIE